MGKEDGGEEALLPLFETKEARFRGAYKVFASTVFVGICLLVCSWLSYGSVCTGYSLSLVVLRLFSNTLSKKDSQTG